MADAPSAILLLRLQSTGSNTNLWGGYLNAALQMLEQASKGYQALAVTGDATIPWTNYATGNIGQCAFLKLTGTLTSAAALTFPSLQNYISGRNASGAAVTIKCSGGTGVTIANGAYFLLYCDGTDYYNAAPTLFPTGITVAGIISGLTAGVANTDGVNVGQMAAAIAASVPLGTAGTFLNSILDTTRGFLADKLTVSGSLVASTTNPGANEQFNIAFTFDDGQNYLNNSVFAF